MFGMMMIEDIKMVQSMKQMDVVVYDWLIVQFDIYYIENWYGVMVE